MFRYVITGRGQAGRRSDFVKARRHLEAHQNYLKGRYHWQRPGDDGLRECLMYLHRAVTLDPLHANPDPNAACADDGASAPSFAINDPFGPNSVVADSGTVFAQTTQGQAGAPTAGQSPSAQAGIENATVDLGGGQLHLTAQLANASAGASCVGGSPSLKSSSTVVGLAINGTPIPAPGQPDQALDQLFSGLSPLAPLVHVVLNHEYSSGDSSSTDQALRREAVDGLERGYRLAKTASRREVHPQQQTGVERPMAASRPKSA